MKRFFVTVLSLALMSLPAFAETNWGFRGSIGLEKKLAKGLDAELEAKYHQTDNFSKTDRWSLGVSLSKRLYRNETKTFSLKAAVGYKFMNVYNGWSTKYKGDLTGIEDGMDPQYYIDNKYSFNYNNSYIDSRHRATASVQASVEKGRFKISLREMYQFTHTDSVEFTKDKYRYSAKNNAWKDPVSEPDGKPASNTQVLRSRISIDYNIPNWKYDPFISYELFNGIDDGFKAQKSRFTAGIEFSFAKKHNFELAYLWQNQHDNDEPAGSFICLGYKFEF